MRHYIASALVAGIVASTVPASAQPVTAFVDVSVIPMDRERVLEHQTVIVRDGRIAALGPASSTRAPAGAMLIDGQGKYLIPGLGDAHAHLSSPGGGAVLADRAVQLYALTGVTMARSMYTEPHHAGVRERIERGELLGPRLMIVSPPVSGQNTPTPEAARAVVQAHKTAGYSVVKVMPGLTRVTFDALVVAAREAGLQLAGHVPGDIGLHGVLGARFVSVEHLDGFIEALNPTPVTPQQSGFFGFGVVTTADDTGVSKLVADVKASGTTVVPTELEMELFTSLEPGAELAKRSEMRYAPAQLVAGWTQQKEGSARAFGVSPERSARYRELRRRLIKEMNAAGVPIAAGSDAFNLFDVAGFGTFGEIETLAASGLTPFQAIASATVNVARLMGPDAEAGTIAAGKSADLVLLDANPLGDIMSLRRQAGVMLRGRWLSRDEIQAKLAAIATAP